MIRECASYRARRRRKLTPPPNALQHRAASVRLAFFVLGSTCRPRPLYDLSKDVVEQNDLATKHPERVRTLFTKLHEWETSFESNPMWISDVYWASFNEKHYDRKYQLEQPE